jgi:hypothetical protein
MARYTIPLNITVTANTTGIIASNKLGFGFRTRNFKIQFPAGCQNTVRVYIIVASEETDPDDVSPASLAGKPAGVDLLGSFSSTGYVVGDDQTVVVWHEQDFEHGNMLVKIFCWNEDTVNDHEINILAEIQSMDIEKMRATRGMEKWERKLLRFRERARARGLEDVFFGVMDGMTELMEPEDESE